MDGKGLKKRLSKIRAFISSHTSLFWAALVVVIVGVIVFLIWWFLPYVDDVYTLIPGYYENEEYNRLTAEKNDLIAENAELLVESDELESSLSSVSASKAGYAELVEINSEIVSVNQDIHERFVEIIAIDEDLMNMHLPDVVRQYVRYSYELDEVRMDIIDHSILLASARRDLAELNGERVEFDDCLAQVNWSGDDKTIGDSVAACTEIITRIRERLVLMETQYEVELELMTNYFTLLQEQWDANAGYYQSISEGDYTKANEYDAVFVDRRREISEINVVDVLNEFYTEGISSISVEIADLGDLEKEKEDLASQWYERSVLRNESE